MSKMVINGFKQVKKITSYTGVARFLAECVKEGDAIGYIDRVPEIPSPYAYSPEWAVLGYRGKNVIYREVSHRTYIVFEVPANVEIRAGE